MNRMEYKEIIWDEKVTELIGGIKDLSGSLDVVCPPSFYVTTKKMGKESKVFPHFLETGEEVEITNESLENYFQQKMIKYKSFDFDISFEIGGMEYLPLKQLDSELGKISYFFSVGYCATGTPYISNFEMGVLVEQHEETQLDSSRTCDYCDYDYDSKETHFLGTQGLLDKKLRYREVEKREGEINPVVLRLSRTNELAQYYLTHDVYLNHYTGERKVLSHKDLENLVGKTSAITLLMAEPSYKLQKAKHDLSRAEVLLRVSEERGESLKEYRDHLLRYREHPIRARLEDYFTKEHN